MRRGNYFAPIEDGTVLRLPSAKTRDNKYFRTSRVQTGKQGRKDEGNPNVQTDERGTGAEEAKEGLRR